MSKTQPTEDIPLAQKIIAILWPSFLSAGLATVLFFTVFDPQQVFANYEITRMGAYSVGFFFFWLFNSLACLMSLFFARPCPSVKPKNTQ